MILDFKLPGMSGLEILDNIANDNALVQPPVVVYSGKRLTNKEIERLQQYTDMFIKKNGETPEEFMDKMVSSIRLES